MIGTIDLNSAMQAVDRLVKSVDTDDPTQTPNAVALDRETVREAITRLCWTAEARDIMFTAVACCCAVDPSEMSFLGLLWYIRQNGGTRRIFETENGAQDSKVVGGYGIVAPMMAARLPAGTVRLNKPVRTIDSRDATTVTVTCSDGERFVARTVVLAIAPVQQLRIEYHPALPPAKLQALQQFKMGNTIKTFAYYDAPFWRELGLNGSAVCDTGIVAVSMDDTKPDGTLPCIMGFALSDQVATVDAMPDAELARSLGAHYAALFGDARGHCVRRVKRSRWASETWIGGALATWSPVCLTTHYKAMTASLAEGRILIAGTETARRNPGYVDGAVEAGERAGRNALVQIGKLPSSARDAVDIPCESVQMPFVPLEWTPLERWLPSLSSFIVGAGATMAGVAAVLALRHSSRR